MTRVDVSLVTKNFWKLPYYIVDRLDVWTQSVELIGIREVRKIPGYHDEPLKGARFGQRSVRLSKSYRVIYREYKDETIEVILVLEVNKHDY